MENLQTNLIETYYVTSAPFLYCVFILNEYESVAMDEYALALN